MFDHYMTRGAVCIRQCNFILLLTNKREKSSLNNQIIMLTIHKNQLHSTIHTYITNSSMKFDI